MVKQLDRIHQNSNIYEFRTKRLHNIMDILERQVNECKIQVE